MNNVPYGGSEVVEVQGVVDGPASIKEISHVDYVQADGVAFSAPLLSLMM
jgi:hypothetical protein